MSLGVFWRLEDGGIAENGEERRDATTRGSAPGRAKRLWIPVLPIDAFCTASLHAVLVGGTGRCAQIDEACLKRVSNLDEYSVEHLNEYF